MRGARRFAAAHLIILLGPLWVRFQQCHYHCLRRLARHSVVQRQVSKLRYDRGEYAVPARHVTKVMLVRGASSQRQRTPSFSVAPSGCDSNSAITTASDAWRWRAAMCSGSHPICTRQSTQPWGAVIERASEREDGATEKRRNGSAGEHRGVQGKSERGGHIPDPYPSPRSGMRKAEASPLPPTPGAARRCAAAGLHPAHVGHRAYIEKRKREDCSVVSARLEARTGLGASRARTELLSLAPFGCESSSALTVASEAWFVAAWCSGKGLSCARRHGRVIYSPNQRNRTVETVYATNPHLITTAD